jgi:hypothetical protein
VTEPALLAHPTLDGVHLVEVDPNEIEIRDPEVKTVTQLATGNRRESYTYAGAGRPLVKSKLEVTVDWAHLGAMRDTVEELVAVPGPHELALWRYKLQTFAGNGARTEFTFPWKLAIDAVATMPGGLPASRFQPKVKVERDGAWLAYAGKDAVDYAAGEPAAGEVWFLIGGTTFKLAAAPAAAAIVYAHLVPAYEVFVSGENDKRFTGPIAEPRRLVFLER